MTPPKQKEPFTRPFRVTRMLYSGVEIGHIVVDADRIQISEVMQEQDAKWLCSRLNSAPPPAMESEREAFEAAFPGRDFGLFGSAGGVVVYNDQLTQYLWRGWLARSAGAREGVEVRQLQFGDILLETSVSESTDAEKLERIKREADDGLANAGPNIYGIKLHAIRSILLERRQDDVSKRWVIAAHSAPAALSEDEAEEDIRQCPVCAGSGSDGVYPDDGSPAECQSCGGEGLVTFWPARTGPAK